MRHGQSEANVEGIVCSSPERGISQYGLTEEGRRQAIDSIEKHPIPFFAIYHSDFKRTTETALIVRDFLKSKGFSPHFEATANLRERFFGDYEGMKDNIYPHIWALDATKGEMTKNVESTQSVIERTLHLIDRLERELSGKQILLVAHGDVSQILLAHSLGKQPSQHREIEHMQTAEIRRLSL